MRTPVIAVKTDTFGVFQIGKLPGRRGVEGQFSLAETEELGREANVRLFSVLLVPNLFK